MRSGIETSRFRFLHNQHTLSSDELLHQSCLISPHFDSNGAFWYSNGVSPPSERCRPLSSASRAEERDTPQLFLIQATRDPAEVNESDAARRQKPAFPKDLDIRVHIGLGRPRLAHQI